MPLPGRDRAFAFESCKAMLAKLAWEAECLERHVSGNGDISEATYWATNGGITAWHLVDWVWADMDEAKRGTVGDKLGIDLGCNKGPERFEAYVTGNKDLNVCRAIALTAKHSILRPASAARFEEIEAEVSIGPTIVMSHGGVARAPYELIVKVDGLTDDMLHVLNRASSWWESFVRTNGIASEF
jgi:hypothetical protein